jgi:AraC-like DNA-binding protein
MHTVSIPSDPPSPWLRLAHLARYDAPGRAAGLRRLDDWEFFVVLAGATWMATADGGRTAMPAGSVALVPPGLVFDWGLEQHTHLAVHFDLHAGRDAATGAAITYLPGQAEGGMARSAPAWRLRCASKTSDIPLLRSVGQAAAWRERFAPLVRLWSRGGAHSLADRLRASGILATALADWLGAGRGGNAMQGAGRVRALLDELATSPVDLHLGVAQLAQRCRMGEPAFRRAFRAATGVSPRRWLERRRVEAVLGMLADPGVPVAHAAQVAGYADPFHFARVVRRVTGCAPSSLRRPP